PVGKSARTDPSTERSSRLLQVWASPGPSGRGPNAASGLPFRTIGASGPSCMISWSMLPASIVVVAALSALATPPATAGGRPAADLLGLQVPDAAPVRFDGQAARGPQGPMPVEDFNPTHVVFLNLPFESATVLPEGRWGVAFDLARINSM